MPYMAMKLLIIGPKVQILVHPAEEKRISMCLEALPMRSSRRRCSLTIVC